MQLYVHPISSNARRARMAALLLDAPVELVTVDIAAGEQRKPEYLALNPNGKVPTLVDGDFVLWESLAIMKYLADRTPGQTLWPTETRARARVDQWLLWTASHWGVAVSQLTYEHLLKKRFGRGDANPYVVERMEALFGDFARVLDGELAQRAFVAGDQLTLADLAIAAPLMYADAARLSLAPHAHVAGWFARMRELPAWQETEPAR